MRASKFILFALITNACSPRGGHKPLPFADAPVGPATIAYEAVKPIFANYCAACHPSRSGPDWLDFNQAQVFVRNGKLVRRVIEEKSMPPPGSAQAAALTENQRRALGAWARAGGPLRVAGAPEAKPTAPESEVERAVKQCLRCHGTATMGPAVQTRYPRLTGQNESYLVAELQRFKWRQRVDPGQEMNDIAADLSDEDIKLVAKYYAQGKSPGLTTERPELPSEARAIFERGRLKAEVECNSCHRNPDRGGLPLNNHFPVLSGQSKKYLINQLIYFRAKQRPGNIMWEMSKNLSNQEIEALALYFSAL